MTSSESATVSGSHTGSVTSPDSISNASQKSSSQKRTVNRNKPYFTTESGRGKSNLNSNWKLNSKAKRFLIATDKETGDKLEYRKAGQTKLKYRKTFDQDGSLRKSHKLNHGNFVVVRNFKRSVEN